MKKIIAILVAAILIGGVVLFSRKENDQQKDMQTSITDVQSQITALNREKEILQQELSALRNNAAAATEDQSFQNPIAFIPQYSLAFISPNGQVYNDAVPIMDKYSLTGLLVFRNGEVPGTDEGILSDNALNYLSSIGWESALSMGSLVNFDQDVTVAEEEFSTALTNYAAAFSQKCGLQPHVIWVEKKQYYPWMDPILTENGFDTLVYTDPNTEVMGSTLTCIPADPYTTCEENFKLKDYAHYQFLTLDCRENASDTKKYTPKGFIELLYGLLEATQGGIMTLDAAKTFISDAQADFELVRKKAQEHADALAEIQEQSSLTEINEETILNRIAEIDEEIKALYR